MRMSPSQEAASGSAPATAKQALLSADRDRAVLTTGAGEAAV